MPFVELPKQAPGLVTNNRTKDSHWGKKVVVEKILEAGEYWAATKTTPISIGQISRKNGGPFPPHKSHRNGNMFDVRPMRLDGKNLRVTVDSKMYDREATRQMIQLMKTRAKVKTILFNDPVLVKEGLTKKYPGHEDHLHFVLDY